MVVRVASAAELPRGHWFRGPAHGSRRRRRGSWRRRNASEGMRPALIPAPKPLCSPCTSPLLTIRPSPTNSTSHLEGRQWHRLPSLSAAQYAAAGAAAAPAGEGGCSAAVSARGRGGVHRRAGLRRPPPARRRGQGACCPLRLEGDERGAALTSAQLSRSGSPNAGANQSRQWPGYVCHIPGTGPHFGPLHAATRAQNRILPTEAVDIVQVNCLEREGRGDAGVFEEASAKVAAGPALLLIDDWAALCDGCGSWRAALPALDGLVTSGRFSAVCVVALRETVPAPALAALHRLARCSARAIAPSANATRVEERDAAAAVAQTRDVTCAVYAVVSETTV